MARVKMEKMLESFNTLTDKPVKYLTVQNDIKEDIENLVKRLYDFTKSQEQRSKVKTDQALQKIIVKGFEEEQIWQQIELQNSQRWDQFVWDVANCMSDTKDLTFPIKFPEENNVVEMEIDEKNATDLDSELSDDENVLPEQVSAKKRKYNKSIMSKPKGKASIVDDQFFKLQDMETFLLKEEKLESKSKNVEDDDEESVDMFEDLDSDGTEDGGKEMMYSDFFNETEDGISENGDGASENDGEAIEHENTSSEYDDENVDMEVNTTKKDRRVRFAQPESDDSQSDDNSDVADKNVNSTIEKDEKKSEFELRQQRLKQQISKLEEKTLTEAPWQLKGEIDASKRPQNSLLEEVLDFDLTTRPPPIITEQTTVTLEGLIMQRVKDKAWDDVVKKEKPVDNQLTFKKPEVLDQSKSKLSLAQVYESEYLKQKQASSGQIEEEKEPEIHVEIRDAMSKLFSKLDALCHYHYTPKPPQAEVKIVSNTPAISMEEVAPVATSDAALLAPEEVKRKRKGDLMSKQERSQTDKNRERRKKKKLQRKKGNVAKVTEHRNTSKGTETNDKSLKTSKAFFQQLNDNATSLIKKSKNKGQ
ncbi:U3 small nucleolar ribonucleoprotein protein MPP10 [Maniola hyperantus]|uniref:U3 small nucleolar ribonucleoprotein protein MPP10 n=1 Tax=Aphantopus hyperantus TaxID=2795564 RepID=UPI001569C1D2|nr:U3 small nucleolar ribonucleoprotein protein MPP10 [Maniola hyperantus]